MLGWHDASNVLWHFKRHCIQMRFGVVARFNVHTLTAEVTEAMSVLQSSEIIF